MRKVSILSLGIVAAVGLLTLPTFAATLSGNDLPDVRLGVGASGDNVIDLNDFFNADGDISYSVAGGGSASADGMLSVDGGAEMGMSTLTVTASSGGESVDKDLTVYVNDFAIGTVAIDNNNRIAGVAGGNIFYNGIVPGDTVSGSGLSIPELGGGGSPAGTSGAALITSIADVSLDWADGFATRNVSVVATGEGSVSAGGLNVTLNSDGSYSLETTSDFTGAWVVSLGVQMGSNVDAVSVLAAQATSVDLSSDADKLLLNPTGSAAQADVSYAADGATVSAPAGDGVLLISNSPISVGSVATLNANVNTSSADVHIAVVAFDGALGSALFYTNPTASSLEANADKNIALTCTPLTGAVIPAIQVFNSGASAATVKINSLDVVMAGSVVDYALNPNATAALPVDGSIPSVDGWGADLVGNGASPATFSSENNFAAGQGSGSLQLDASAGDTAVAQGYLAGIALSQGTVVAESHVKSVGAGAGVFAMVLLDGATFDCGAFPGGADLPTDSFAKVQTSGTVSGSINAFFVVQASGGLNALVDDVSVRVVDDSDMWFDSSLLGM